MSSKEEVFSLNSYTETKEGFPVYTPGRYLVRYTDGKVITAKSGHDYVRFSPVIVESDNDDPTVDGDEVTVRGKKLRFDSLYLTPNAMDGEGTLRSEREIADMTARMRGQLRGVVTRLTGEEPDFEGTEKEVAEQVKEALNGITFVATLARKGQGDDQENIITSHRSEEDWG